VAKEK